MLKEITKQRKRITRKRKRITTMPVGRWRPTSVSCVAVARGRGDSSPVRKYVGSKQTVLQSSVRPA
eukprot:859100-Heterocapsa_arctica.AAC.1